MGHVLPALHTSNNHVIHTGCESEAECLEKLQLAMNRLTKPHYNALNFLLKHLNR